MPAVKRIDRVRAHRQRLREAGMRPVQIWVPDTRTTAFAAEARRQSRLIADNARDTEDQAFVDAIGWGSLEDDA
jgi:hypothetical protein